MISATADTNIYISGLLFGGVPERFLRHAAAHVFRLDISDAILNELLRVLREKFLWDAAQLRKVEVDIRLYTNHVKPTQTVTAIRTDPSHNRILECAVEAGRDFIVSGDSKDVLPLGSYAGIPIVTVADFIALLERTKTN